MAVKHINHTLTNKNLEKIRSRIPVTTARGKIKIYPFLAIKINQFCRDIIYPNIEEFKKPTKKVKSGFLMVERKIGDTTNIELLNIFARYHKVSVAKAVYMFILFSIQEQEQPLDRP